MSIRPLLAPSIGSTQSGPQTGDVSPEEPDPVSEVLASFPLAGSQAHGVVLGRHLVTVPALAPMAATLRSAVGDLLADHPRCTDAQPVVNEFANYALIEQRCGCCRHGPITLAVDCDEHRIRLEISYHLALSHTPDWRMDWYENPDETYGLSLAIINAHIHRPADRWGHIARQIDEPYYADKHQTWYAELDHAPRHPAPASRLGDVAAQPFLSAAG